MMKFAFFEGCNIPARVNQYADATRAVLKKMDVKLVEIRGFNCCGYPLRNLDRKAFFLSSVKNLALAEESCLDILAMCKCCFGNLKKAEHLLMENADLWEEANEIIGKEGLRYEGKYKVKHLLSVLHDDLGIDALEKKIVRKYKDLNIAASHGCHALRPSKITRFDDPVEPKKFDALVAATGAKSIDWTSKLECCGAPLTGVNDDIATAMTQRKLADAKQADAHYLCSACPFCHLQLETVLKRLHGDNGKKTGAILYPQLLGLCMGIDEGTLGISKNLSDISGITSFL